MVYRYAIQHSPVRRFFTLMVASLAVALVVGAASVALAADLHSARCKRAGDLKHWRCEVSCAGGESGIANCPTQSDWGACGRQVLREACGITEATPAVACQRKVVLAGADFDALETACDASYSGVDEVLEGPFKTFPGLAYRPLPAAAASDPASER